MAQIIDGKKKALALREDVARRTQQLKEASGIVPGLAVVLAGDDPASQVYVRNKGIQAVEAGFESFTHRLADSVSEDEVLSLVETLNQDDKVHGILVQLPLPKHIDEQKVIDRINPDKDVDGFHVTNAGRLAVGLDGFVPCTPLGCSMMIRDCRDDLSGLHAVVVGRSNIVGKPMAALLLQANCTVTIAHSRTRDLPALCREADILVAAVGRPHMIKGDWIKPGAIVIDVGINRVEKEGGGTRLIGDVDYDAAAEHAGFITPVPGGVGPMTIACLLSNTLLSASRHAARLSG